MTLTLKRRGQEAKSILKNVIKIWLDNIQYNHIQYSNNSRCQDEVIKAWMNTRKAIIRLYGNKKEIKLKDKKDYDIYWTNLENEILKEDFEP